MEVTEAQRQWERFRPQMKIAVERSGRYTIEYVEGEIEAGNMRFWAGEKAAVVTKFSDYPNGRALVLFALAGQSNAALDELLVRLDPVIQAFAKANGCAWVDGWGRFGWVKPSKKIGYHPLWVVLSKEVV